MIVQKIQNHQRKRGENKKWDQFPQRALLPSPMYVSSRRFSINYNNNTNNTNIHRQLPPATPLDDKEEKKNEARGMIGSEETPRRTRRYRFNVLPSFEIENENASSFD